MGINPLKRSRHQRRGEIKKIRLDLPLITRVRRNCRIVTARNLEKNEKIIFSKLNMNKNE